MGTLILPHNYVSSSNNEDEAPAPLIDYVTGKREWLHYRAIRNNLEFRADDRVIRESVILIGKIWAKDLLQIGMNPPRTYSVRKPITVEIITQ